MTDVMQKTPADILDFDVDFARWLKEGDRIVMAETTIAGETMTRIDRTDFSNTLVRVWLSGGSHGDTGQISVIVTTVEDRIKEFCFKIKVRECC